MFSSLLEVVDLNSFDDSIIDCVDIIAASFSFFDFDYAILYFPMNVGVKSNDPHSSSNNFVTGEIHSSLSSTCKGYNFVVGVNVLRGFIIHVSVCKQFSNLGLDFIM